MQDYFESLQASVIVKQRAWNAGYDAHSSQANPHDPDAFDGLWSAWEQGRMDHSEAINERFA